MEPHACTAEWTDGRLTVWTGHADAVQRAQRSWPACSGWRPSDVRVIVPPMGGSLRRQDVLPAGAHRRRAGAQGRPSGARGARPRRGLRDPQPPPGALPRAARRARADGTFVGRRVWAWWDTGAYADTGPNVAAKGGWAAVGPVPLRPRRGRLRLRLHPPAADRRLPRLRRHPGRVGLRAGGRPAGRAARRRPAGPAPAEPAARRRGLRHGRGAARLPRRRVPGGRRRAHRLARRTGAARACAR